MRRGDYIRLTVYRAPDDLHAPNASVLVLISEKVSIMEGWLIGHIQAGGQIRLEARVKDQKLVSGRYTSSPINSVSNQYVQTDRLVYEVSKIPPSRSGETFTDFA